MTALPRVRTGLLKHPLDKQVMVYDTRWDKVHLLDPTTACVLELLEEGGWTAEGITAELAVRLDIAPNPALLPLAIEQLRQAPLLDEQNPASAAFIDVNRRELLRTAAVAGVAVLLIPTVATLTATRGYAQGTAPNHGVGNTCTGNSQCISGNCCNNLCIATSDTCFGAGSVPNGGTCTQTVQCSSPGAVCNGVCQGPTGAACGTNNAACQSNHCCSTVCQATAGTPDGGACAAGPAAQAALNNNTDILDCSCASNNCRRNGSNTRCVVHM
jgi:hypothetical protein